VIVVDSSDEERDAAPAGGGAGVGQGTKQCEECKRLHDGSYGAGRFCSSSCVGVFGSRRRGEAMRRKSSALPADSSDSEAALSPTTPAPAIRRACPSCGTLHSNPKFCSRACAGLAGTFIKQNAHKPPPLPRPRPVKRAFPNSSPSSGDDPMLDLGPTRPCENCGAWHNGTYGAGRFCSTQCAWDVGARERRRKMERREVEGKGEGQEGTMREHFRAKRPGRMSVGGGEAKGEREEGGRGVEVL